ncbi:MAG: Sensor protein, partial [Myxococcales bacterium]|nr:Sensor protein [Myxococcales bacterium]
MNDSSPTSTSDPTAPVGDAPFAAADCLLGGGEMGAMMRALDWSRTPVGPVASWPQSLRTAVSILLESRFPMYIAWGPQYTQFYNDGYRPVLGSTKHPAAMGLAAAATFAESWHIIGPMFDGVRQGVPVGAEDWMLPLDRHGFLEECYFTFSYSPIRDESGTVGGVLVTVTETTDRVLGERRLNTLRELSSQTNDASTAETACATAGEILANNRADIPVGLVYLLDRDGKHATLAAAAGLARGTAASPERVVLTEESGPWPLAAVASSGTAMVVEGGDGPLPRRALILPIARAGAARPAGILVAALSPRLLFDAKYRSFLELVAGQIATAIASARALQEAKARAAALAEIDHAKTAFFSNVSHEFRTPLTLLLGPAEESLARIDSLPADDVARWQLVHRNGLRLLKLVNTLLDFSRIEAGRVHASYQPTDLGMLTRELAGVFESAIERAGLRLTVAIDDIGEPVYVDRDMWEKIVLNLLSNALKFTFQGGIDVALRRRDDGVVLTVRDSGIGVTAEQLPYLFDRFHRVQGARSRTHEGTGIGLALVQELIKLHGGRVTVESVVDRGSTFTVTIPLGSAHLPAEQLAAPRDGTPTALGAAPFVEEALRWSTGASSP